MKIEKLTDNKIRIILNIDELAKKNIDVHSLIKNTDVAQKLFKKILKQAEKEVGFDVSDSRLLIEAFSSPDGFFVLTFTKLAVEENILDTKLTKLKVKRKMPCSSCSRAIYQFDSFEDFCSFCTYSHNSNLGDLRKFAKNVSLYEYSSSYFLIFSGINKSFSDLDLFYSSISEFAKLASNSSCFESKLVEFGKPIFKTNAIKLGIKYFADVH